MKKLPAISSISLVFGSADPIGHASSPGKEIFYSNGGKLAGGYIQEKGWITSAQARPLIEKKGRFLLYSISKSEVSLATAVLEEDEIDGGYDLRSQEDWRLFVCSLQASPERSC
jgi:hypothetical protein